MQCLDECGPMDKPQWEAMQDLHAARYIEKYCINPDFYTAEHTAVLKRAVSALQERARSVTVNKPLTKEQLKQMDGCPVWIGGGINKYGIVKVDNIGSWKGVPYVLTTIEGSTFEWDIEARNLLCYLREVITAEAKK